MAKKYSKKTPEEKKAELEELSESILKQIEKYTTSLEDLKEYFDYMSQFYNYSARNVSLIKEQHIGAVAVASFKDWSKKGYSVNKGEKGIKILSFTPITFYRDKNGDVKQLRYASSDDKAKIKSGEIDSWKTRSFKIGHVFDISQTNAPLEDLPNIFPNRQYNFEIEDHKNIDYLSKGIKNVGDELGIEINDVRESKIGFDELGNAKGAFVQSGGIDGSKEIVMNSRNTETQALATAIHELAHAKLHDLSLKKDYDTPTKEFQAEMVSYMVCKHYGMDTSEEAVPYIAAWTSNGQKIQEKERTLNEIHATSSEFIEIIDTTIELERERELHHYGIEAKDNEVIASEYSMFTAVMEL